MEHDSERIRELNDRLRQGLDFTLGRIMLTLGVQRLEDETRKKVLIAVREYDDFTPDNDAYGEHDFGVIEEDRQRFFFKIDYYDKNLQHGSENPADPEATCRVLTIMKTAEY